MLWQKLGLPACSSHALWGWRQLWPLPGTELGRGSRVLAAEPEQGPRPAKPHPSAPAAGISPSGSADPPWALSCPALPTKGQRWWPPACTWLDLSAVLSGGSGWLWPRPPTTGWWRAATPSPPAGKWMSWGPRGCGICLLIRFLLEILSRDSVYICLSYLPRFLSVPCLHHILAPQNHSQAFILSSEGGKCCLCFRNWRFVCKPTNYENSVLISCTC